MYGDSPHRDVNIRDIILALNLCHFISMGFECMRLGIFSIQRNNQIICAKGSQELASFDHPLQIRNVQIPNSLHWKYR